MRVNLSRMSLLAIAVAWPAVVQSSDASWLDRSEPPQWNTPGASIPVAPESQGPMDARCREQARPAESAIDRLLADRGWWLVGPYQRGWHTTVVRATASYDGMCRPRQYQDFVFVRDAYAGTLSPRPMDSRTDGAVGGVSIEREGRVVAEYARYAAADPLCCPSRTSTVTFEIAADASPVVRPVSSAAQPRGQSTPTALAGTTWRLIRFEGGDDTTLVPDDPAKYTLEFLDDGQLAVRIDCNRGRGRWRSSGSGQLRFGELALTRAQCRPGSLHDQVVRQWDRIRSYVVRDGHLFLALMADGGIYEFEPAAAPK